MYSIFKYAGPVELKLKFVDESFLNSKFHQQRDFFGIKEDWRVPGLLEYDLSLHVD